MFCSSSSLSNNCRSMSSFRETMSLRDRSIFVSFCSRALSIDSTVDFSVSFSASRILQVLSSSSARYLTVWSSSLDCSSSTIATTKQHSSYGTAPREWRIKSGARARTAENTGIVGEMICSHKSYEQILRATPISRQSVQKWICSLKHIVEWKRNVSLYFVRTFSAIIFFVFVLRFEHLSERVKNQLFHGESTITYQTAHLCFSLNLSTNKPDYSKFIETLKARTGRGLVLTLDRVELVSYLVHLSSCIDEVLSSRLHVILCPVQGRLKVTGLVLPFDAQLLCLFLSFLKLCICHLVLKTPAHTFRCYC